MSDKNTRPTQSTQPDLELNSCSAYDCTGLIPAAVTDEAQAEAYEQLYPYLSPEIKRDKKSDE